MTDYLLEFSMFKDMLNTQILDGKQLTLVAGGQTHDIIFDSDLQIEYFQLDVIIKPCNKTIQGMKACDYIIINHSDKSILFCELKNAKNKGNTSKQLRHSKHIMNCFFNLLEQELYTQKYLVFNKKAFNKNKTKNKITTKDCSHFKYSYTGKVEINWNSLCAG